MRKLMVGFVCFLAFGIDAQVILPEVYDTLQREKEIILLGELDYGASKIRNEFVSILAFGGYLSDEIKDHSYDSHKDMNRVGVFANPSLVYADYGIQLFKNKDWGMRFSASANTVATARYTKDLFGLAFYGNKQFLGSVISLTGTSFTNMSAYRVGAGFISSKSKSYVSINYSAITSMSDAFIQTGVIEQDSLGFDAYVDLDGNFRTARGNSIKGHGVSFDAGFYLPLEFGKRKNYLKVEISNLGVAVINDMMIYDVDTTLNFDGLRFNQIIGENNVLSEDFNVLDAMGVKKDSANNVVQILPFSLNVGKIIDDQNEQLVQSFFGIRVISSYGMSPMFYAGAQIRPIDWLRIGVGAAYGGTTNLRGTFYVQGVWKNINAGLSTMDVYGLASKNAWGKSVGLRLNYRL